MRATATSSSLRTQGPITTGRCCCAKAVDEHLPKRPPRHMGPCVRRGDGENRCCDVGARSMVAYVYSRTRYRPSLRRRPCRVRGLRTEQGRRAYFRGGRHRLNQPATCLMRAISSSTALSTGTFSLTTRFIALAQTFSLLRIVNFQFLVKSNGVVPPVN